MFDRLSKRLQRDLARAEVDVRERVAPRLKSDVRYRRSVIILTTVAAAFWLAGCVLIVFGNYWQGALCAVVGMCTSRGGGKWLNRDHVRHPS